MIRRSGLTLDWGDQRGNHRQNFKPTLLKHIENALYSEKAVRVLFLADSFEEHRQVVVVLKLGNVDFPLDTVIGGAMLCLNWEVTPHVESSESSLRDSSWVHRSCSWLCR